jgi:hypothetical protein
VLVLLVLVLLLLLLLVVILVKLPIPFQQFWQMQLLLCCLNVILVVFNPNECWLFALHESIKQKWMVGSLSWMCWEGVTIEICWIVQLVITFLFHCLLQSAFLTSNHQLKAYCH